ncbi:MAG: hypothetical protein AAGM67_20710, partial [Bacteroidota bacterium]
MEKAHDDYTNRSPAPAPSWLYDIVRGKVLCSSIQQLRRSVSVLRSVVESRGGSIVRIKNRCVSPSISGLRDILVNIRLRIPHPSDPNRFFFHICEVQIHVASMKALDIERNSHSVYEYFRSYFAGNLNEVQSRMALFGTLSAHE